MKENITIGGFREAFRNKYAVFGRFKDLVLIFGVNEHYEQVIIDARREIKPQEVQRIKDFFFYETENPVQYAPKELNNNWIMLYKHLKNQEDNQC